MKDEKTLDAMIGSLIDRKLEVEEARREFHRAEDARFSDWEDRARPVLTKAVGRGEIRTTIFAIRDGEVYRIDFNGDALPKVARVHSTIIDLGSV